MSNLPPGEHGGPAWGKAQAEPTRIELLEAFVAAYDADAGVDEQGIAKSTYGTRQAVLRAREAIK